MIKYTNPYADVSQQDSNLSYRINAVISREDYEFIRSVSPIHGVMQYIVGTLIKNFVNQLKQNGITEYNPTAIETILSRCANSGFTTVKSVRHDGKRAPRLHNDNAKHAVTGHVQE